MGRSCVVTGGWPAHRPRDRRAAPGKREQCRRHRTRPRDPPSRPHRGRPQPGRRRMCHRDPALPSRPVKVARSSTSPRIRPGGRSGGPRAFASTPSVLGSISTERYVAFLACRSPEAIRRIRDEMRSLHRSEGIENKTESLSGHMTYYMGFPIIISSRVLDY